MTQQEHDPSKRWPGELGLDEGEGPALPISAAHSEALIQGALQLAERTSLPAAQGAHPQALARRSASRLALQVAAGALLALVGMGSASAAVMWWAARRATPAHVEARPPAHRAAGKRGTSEWTPAEPGAQHHAESVVPEPLLPAPTAQPERPGSADARRGPRAPEDFLSEANRLRAAGRWREADEAYARVWKTAPKSSAAYVARVAAASVRLEHRNDAHGALASYRAALAQNPDGPLGEEARFGLAEAQRLLGDAAEERRALERFLSAHPDSPLAARARKRLEALPPTERAP